jgi:hypothetical protein
VNPPKLTVISSPVEIVASATMRVGAAGSAWTVARAGGGTVNARDGVDELGVDELGVDELGVDELGVDELGVDELGVDELGVDELGVDELGVDELGVDGGGVTGAEPPEMVNLKPMGTFPLIWYLPPKVKNEPPIVNVPEDRLSATQVPEVNVAPVDGRLAEIAPAESMRRRNALDPFMLKENPITANESSGSGTSLNASALADAKTVETPAVAKFASSTPVVLLYRATVVLLGGGPIIPPPERLSANRRYMWAPMIFASFIRALRAKTPLLPKLPTRDPFASNFLIVDVLVI